MSVVVPMAKLNPLANQIRELNEHVGWVTPEEDTVDHQLAVLMLVVSEVCEAVEEIRAGHSVTETYYNISLDGEITHTPPEPFEIVPGVIKYAKPEGVPSEIADAIIRLLDFSAARKIDIDKIIAEKLTYNLTRGHRHGGKLI